MGNKSKAALYITVPAYAAGIWLLHRHLGGFRWYLWVAAIIFPLLVFYFVMIALSIIEDRKYGKPVFCGSCGEVHDLKKACPFCGVPRQW